MKLSKKLQRNRIRGSGEGSRIGKAVEEKDKEYKRVVLKEEGLQDLDDEVERVDESVEED